MTRTDTMLSSSARSCPRWARSLRHLRRHSQILFAIFLRGLLACSLIVAGANAALAQTPPADAPKTAPEPAPEGAEAPAAPPPGRVTETPAVVIDGNAAQTLLGKPVQSVKGEDLGRVVDVVVDRSGLLRAAIIDFGGFLGVGTRKIAVDWRMLHFPDRRSDEQAHRRPAARPVAQSRRPTRTANRSSSSARRGAAGGGVRPLRRLRRAPKP